MSSSLFRQHEPADVLIIGSGIMGAAVAATIRAQDARARIVMVDGGTAIGDTPGLHLHETPDEAIWSRYNQQVGSGIQGFYAPQLALDSPIPHSPGELRPGVHRLAMFGEQAAATPGAAASWNVGGMGVHWTAATPRPWDFERYPIRGDWDAELTLAERLLHVHPGPLGPSAPGARVLEILQDHLAAGSPERAPRAMPMAVRPAGGWSIRTGPSTIFPPIGDGSDKGFVLLEGTLALGIQESESQTRSVRVRDLRDGTESDLAAHYVVVCADPHRTPQLLFASGVRHPALGSRLNCHAFISGRVLVDLDRLGMSLNDLPWIESGEFALDSLWVPHDGGDRPFHVQVMCTVFTDEQARPLAYSAGFSLYVPVESSPANRIAFSDEECDVLGLPRMTIHAEYSPADRRLIDRGRVFLADLARTLGTFDPDTESAVLPAGTALHQTGTVPAGPSNDGTSICDDEGRVWDMSNVFVAGTAVIPTAMACNTTLTGVVSAIRAGRRIAAELAAAR